MNQTAQTRWIAFSERVYRTLLMLYPADYRREYGALMLQLFRDVARDQYRQRGMMGMALWWCKTLLDLSLTVIEERRKVKFMLSKSAFSQLTGIFLIVGGIFSAIAAFSQLQPDNHYPPYYGVYQVLTWLFVPGFVFVGLGCIGLGLRYGPAMNRPGQWTLYLSGMSALLMTIGVIGISTQSLWTLWFITTAILHTVVLTAFGLLHLQKPVLPIFRALPLQIGAGWLFLWLGVPNLFPQPVANLLSFFLFLGVGLAWLAIGQTVHRQRNDVAMAAA